MHHSSATFWSRVGALIIDSILLGVLGYILVAMFEDAFMKMGNNGLLIGFFITVAYFTLSHSHLLNGQTTGKKLMNIQVVDQEERLLTVQKSLTRSLVLFIPYFLMDYRILGIAADHYINLAADYVSMIFLLGVALVYILNKYNRKTLHDFIAGTRVVATAPEFEPLALPKVKPYVFYAYAAFAIALTGAYAFTMSAHSPELTKLALVKENLEKLDGVQEAGAHISRATIDGSFTQTLTGNLVLSTGIKDLPKDATLGQSPMAKAAVQSLLDSYPSAEKLDLIKLQFLGGYNIGISKSSESLSISRSPEQWRALLK